jgi:hypothetical protein
MQFRSIYNYDSHRSLRGWNCAAKRWGMSARVNRAEAISCWDAFGCRIPGYGSVNNPKTTSSRVTSLEKVTHPSDIILFHCPLTPENHHKSEKKPSQEKDGHA